MDELMGNFNIILNNKNKEVEDILISKNKKMKVTLKIDQLDYASKKTINLIENEKIRKYKSSKAYKKEQENSI